MIELKVPDIGDFKDVEVIEVLVSPGDEVKAEQSLITIESDKASMEIPATAGGTIKELKVKVGDKINEGTVIATAEEAGGGASSPKPAEQAAAEDTKKAVPSEATAAPEAAAAGKAPPPPAAAPSGGGSTDIAVPDIGDFKDVEVIEVLVKVGDTVTAEQSLITVESDKASMEIPSSGAGTIKELKVKVGDKINKGDVIAVLDGGGTASAPAPAPAASGPAPTQAVAPAPAPVTAKAEAPAAPAPATSDQTLAHASPSVRKFARELGVDLNLVKGSGPKSRVTQEDVQGFVKAALAGGGAKPAAAAGGALPGNIGASGFGNGWPAWPSLDFSKFGPTETEALSRIKKISGPNLARNWAVIPHVTQYDEADVTDLEKFRKTINEQLGKRNKDAPKVTMLAFVMKACVAALKQYPAMNSSLSADGASLILKKYYHLGFAADTPNGLVVPVVRDCDKKGVAEIAKETAEIAAQARAGKLGPTAMQGATFSISSLGGIGGTQFTPIINAPEVGILGLAKSEFKPKWDGKAFQPRLILPLCLSYDHRVIDGAQGARFTTYLAEVLADMRRTLL
jgi:pyruvate dehydrogenase E2 component (dihydrolipoamide acetyltransferase)